MGLRKRGVARWAVLVTLVIIFAGELIGYSAAEEADESKTKVEAKIRHRADKACIMRLVKAYFVARDRNWIGPEQVSAELPDGEVSDEAVQKAAVVSRIAAEIAAESGLQATKVRSGLAKKRRIKIHGRKATVKVTAGTALKWNIPALGKSLFSDTYTVQLTRSKKHKQACKKKRWRIVDVSYTPIPSTELPSTPQSPLGAEAATETTAVIAAATGSYDRQKAAEYALRWSRSRFVFRGDLIVSDQYNPEYDNARQDNDCTNFASQALHAGGWPIHDGFASSNPVNWTPDLFGPRGSSKTWSVASWLYDYAGNPKRGEKWVAGPPIEAVGIWELQPGDLLFVDWDPNKHFDGTIDHTMVISGNFTELGFTEPTYSQHTPHRYNMPLSIGIKIATAQPPPVDPGDGTGGQGRVLHFYPVHVKDTFEIE